MATTAPKKIAVACQGGGTHVAFTWGVLSQILAAQRDWVDEGGPRFEITALSGTSAGAMSAMAAWYGLAPNSADPSCGSLDKAIERLDTLWTVFAADKPIEALHNAIGQTYLHWSANGLPVPTSSPYRPMAELAMAGLEVMGARPEYLGFEGLLRTVCPDFDRVDWAGVADRGVRVVLGAVEVLSGNVETFDSDKTLEEMGLREQSPREGQPETRWRLRRPLMLDGVAASGTLPEFLPAQKIDDLPFPTKDGGVTRRDGYYWDGLYAQNPPVRDLLARAHRDEKPDEIWVIRINPQEYATRRLNPGIAEIRDRTNDLAGNVALNAELDHILTVNRWIERFGNDDPALAQHKPVVVRTIKMSRKSAWTLDATSKFDRSPGHLGTLRDEGARIGQEWLDAWRTRGDDMANYPNDARYSLTL